METGPQKNLEHLRIASGAPPGEAIQGGEQEAACDKAVEQVESGRSHQKREEEQSTINTAQRERAVESAVDHSILRKVGAVHGTSLARSEQPGEELDSEQTQAAAEDDAADLTLGAALAEHEHQAADDNGHERE